ncbi:MAG: peptidylprolyl isomerase [Pirellulaceae bacterium]
MHSQSRILSITLLYLIAPLAMIFTAGCSSSDTSLPDANISSSKSSTNSSGLEEDKLTVSTSYRAEDANTRIRERSRAEAYPEVLISTSLGDIRLRLDANKAPATVHNFLSSYVERDYYDGVIFHYVQPGGMILAGLFDAELKPREPRSEIQNEATNGLTNKRGTIAMSRDPEYIHSSTSQFFINCADNPALDHIAREESADYGYCVFGEVIEGMNVVDAIASVPVTSRDQFVNIPVEPVVIHSAKRIK